MKHLDVDKAAELIRSARQAAGFTQAELARRAGLRQSHIAAMETGQRTLSAEMLARVLQAAGYRPSVPLEAHADEIVRLADRGGIRDVRVFGSITRGQDTFTSDIDLLVTLDEDRSYVDVASFINSVEDLTGFSVDVVIDHGTRPEFLDDQDVVPL